MPVAIRIFCNALHCAAKKPQGKRIPTVALLPRNDVVNCNFYHLKFIQLKSQQEETTMLKNIPPILSPELLKVLAEMGHSDRICIGDGNFPGARMAKAKNAIFIRADGHGVPELLDAILQVIPLDTYVDTPAMIMEVGEQDKGLEIPIWNTYKEIIAKYDDRGAAAVGQYERFKFYDEAQDCYCIIQTGETAIYANIILQKGVIK